MVEREPERTSLATPELVRPGQWRTPPIQYPPPPGNRSEAVNERPELSRQIRWRLPVADWPVSTKQ